MNDKHLDEALKDLQAELSVTPSPEFAAKVRERIEQAPAKPSWNVWAWAGVAATCAVAVVAVAVWRGGRSETVATQPVTLAEAQPAVTTASRPAPFEPTVMSPVRAPAAPVVRTTAKRAEPEVLVPPDQLIAIRRLMAAVRAGVKIDLPASPMLFDPETGELIPLKPIDIPLITVDPLPGLPDGKSGGSERK